MKHNLVSPQQGIGRQDENKENSVGSAEMAAKQQGNDKFGVPQEQIFDRQNKDGSEAARRSSAALSHEGIPVCPRESGACDDGKEKKSLSEQESSADQPAQEDKFYSLPLQLSVNQEDTGEISSCPQQSPKEQDGSEKDLVSTRQMPSGQQDNLKTWVSSSNEAMNHMGFCRIANESEDNTKPNCSSSQEKFKDQQDGQENFVPPCKNNGDQLPRINTRDQLHAENEMSDTRF